MLYKFIREHFTGVQKIIWEYKLNESLQESVINDSLKYIIELLERITPINASNISIYVENGRPYICFPEVDYLDTKHVFEPYNANIIVVLMEKFHCNKFQAQEYLDEFLQSSEYDSILDEFDSAVESDDFKSEDDYLCFEMLSDKNRKVLVYGIQTFKTCVSEVIFKDGDYYFYFNSDILTDEIFEIFLSEFTENYLKYIHENMDNFKKIFEEEISNRKEILLNLVADYFNNY